ncbi:MAG: DUF1743 domain-containing protein [Desulfurococcales archaeon]|nr:DUF1743 domain-containing protein [Desulfurococcales archaeon]
MSSIFEVLHIGIDDIDSPSGGCTTHAAYRLVKELLHNFRDLRLIDYPNLVRLNPAIPFKTRGNGAVSIRVAVRRELIGEVIELVVKSVRDYVRSYEYRSDEDYGVAVLIGDVPDILKSFYRKALTDFIHRDYLMRVLRSLKGRLATPLGIRRGLIGALAAIGWFLKCDCTYELISYRTGGLTPDRCIDVESVKQADIRFRNKTFLNFDYIEDRVLIAPHGPDPVLAGIRGEEPHILAEVFNTIRFCESVEGWMIFRTNQGTDAHLICRDLSSFRYLQTGCTKAVVDLKPRILPGGDVIFRVKDPINHGQKNSVWVAVFKETGLTGVARELVEGDEAYVCGSVRYWIGLGPVLHLEKLVLTKLAQIKVVRNPRCPRCGARMKSSGRNKGWKCIKCGFRTREAEKDVQYIKRELRRRTYIPKDSAVKHLTKPAARYGRERDCIPTEPKGKWIS